MADPDTLDEQLDLQAQLSEVGRAIAWCEALGEGAGWPPRLVFGLTVSMEEALMNIVSYGFPAGPPPGGARIRLRCTAAGGRVQMRIEDNGVPFDPTTLAGPPPAASVEEAKVGGHGVQLIRHFMDEVRYACEGGHNVLVFAVRVA